MNFLFYFYGASVGFAIGLVVGVFLRKPRRSKVSD